MAEIHSALSTFPATLDTFTSISDVVTEILSAHQNGPASAIINLETEIGTGAKGTSADLTARLSHILGGDGSLRKGTVFPSIPTPQDADLFWRTDLKQLYIFDGALAQFQRIDSTNDHGALGGLADDDHNIYLLTDGTREATGNLDTTQNLRFKSGTAFQMILDHAATAARTITFPDLTGTLVIGGGGQGLVVDADINAGAAISQSKLVDIVNADISAGAAIADSKLAAIKLTKLDLNAGGAVFDSGDKMIAGTVKLARMQRTEVSSENAGIVTVLLTLTIITDINLGTVNSGDRVLVSAFVRSLKGGTAGDNRFFINKSAGTATIQAYNNFSAVINEMHAVVANKTFDISMFGIIKVTGTGTLTLRFRSTSAGGNSTISVGAGELHGIVLNNG